MNYKIEYLLQFQCNNENGKKSSFPLKINSYLKCSKANNDFNLLTIDF